MRFYFSRIYTIIMYSVKYYYICYKRQQSSRIKSLRKFVNIIKTLRTLFVVISHFYMQMLNGMISRAGPLKLVINSPGIKKPLSFKT